MLVKSVTCPHGMGIAHLSCYPIAAQEDLLPTTATSHACSYKYVKGSTSALDEDRSKLPGHRGAAILVERGAYRDSWIVG